MLLIGFVFVVISTSVAYLCCVCGNKYFCCLFVCFWVYMVVVIGTSVAHLFVLCLCGCGNKHLQVMSAANSSHSGISRSTLRLVGHHHWHDHDQ